MYFWLLLELVVSASTGDFVNVGTGVDQSIKKLAETICEVVYQDIQGRVCEISWDTSKPNGTPKKLLDVSRLHNLGWKASMPLREGIRKAYEDFQK